MFAALGLVPLLLTSTACAAEPESPIEPPPQNRSEWTMPLDEFVSNDAHLRDYAEALLERDCYAEHGIEWLVPWQPTDVGAGPSFSAGEHRLFTSTLATEFGYHTAPNTYNGVSEWREFVARASEIANTTPDFGSIMDDCQARSRKALPTPSNEALYYATEAALTLSAQAETDEAVAQPGKEWAACMSSKGYDGVPTNPLEWPSDALEEQWQVGIPGSTPAPDEIAMATADADCAESSGWSEAFYQANWSRQIDFIAENADRLVRIRSELKDDKRRLLRAVAENAPTK
ncbi:hypothetical protein IF188_08655 [Microbacterium sp. NEAU-LLC]|uniref:Uncharacterized protein n=1 Tax=Microbacterium helvum TaxID=2773713 RepID=A0ABR8NM73_9MICO|nr:hypothetical protein [Microbacterium helvum]MBD3941760.1 hypothetical protein [Microbacterium helvum]